MALKDITGPDIIDNEKINSQFFSIINNDLKQECKTYKGNFISFLTIGLSVLTILYTQPTSYTVHISKSLAMFGPFTICIIGFIILLANTLFNIKLIKKLIYLKLD